MKGKTYLGSAGYILFFLCLTVVFSIMVYPRENLTHAVNGWLSEVSGQALRVGEVSFKPLVSLKLGDIVLDAGKERKVLGDAVVSPLFRALLTGKKAVSGKLDGPWASSRFKVQARQDGWSLDVDSLEVVLDTLPLPEDLPLKLEGNAEAVLEIDVPDPSNIRLQGQGQVTGTDIRALGGALEALGLSPLRFSSMSLFFTIQDNVLTLNENNLTGDISANARGTVRLVPLQPGSSRLDLTLDIKPGPEARERLSPLFSLIGLRQRANGSVLLRIRGTVDRPSVTS
jgi:type II secretion system protein N